ncbi:MAG: hypothetical protein V4641_05435 [Pseudomonadota bacterium]
MKRDDAIAILKPIIEYRSRHHQIPELMEAFEVLSASTADYEETLADHRRLVRELDVILHGEDGAAPQASLCDLVAKVAAMGECAQTVVTDANLIAMGRVIARRAGESWDAIGDFAQQVIKETQIAALEASGILSERQAAMQGQGGEVPSELDELRLRFAEVCEERDHLNGLLFGAALQPPQPVRSVSDEDVQAAVIASLTEYDDGTTEWDGYSDSDKRHSLRKMRAALEHFAKGKPHDQD